MDREKILQILADYHKAKRNKLGITRLGIFGSVARGEIRETSDVDVVVELNKPDLFILVEIKQELEKRLNRPVDIVRYRKQMNSFLKKRIEKNAIYV